METGWRYRNNNSSFSNRNGGGQDSNLTNNAWDQETWDNISTPHPAASVLPEASVLHALLSGVTPTTTLHHPMPDHPHTMCLKLGKRHYYEDAVVPDRHVMSVTKRGKTPYPYTSATKTAVSTSARVTSSTRCQVEGCNVALGNVKEYYRRHKVCEVHSKAPNVVVSGVQQRFCQQCSRFHNVTEFDETKRSCRRRLEGHNLRRRKGTLPTFLPRSFPHSHEQRLDPLSTLPPSPSPSSSESKPVRALSLLSSPKTEPWISSGDLSSRCSAALYELIAANRATSVSGHFLNQNNSHHLISDNTMHTPHGTQTWDRFTYDYDA